MNMIVFPVKFNKFRLKITANTGKYFLQVVKNDLCEDAIAILCNKDQMGMKKEYAVSSSTNIVDFFRECPAYTLLYQFSPKDTGQSKVK